MKFEYELVHENGFLDIEIKPHKNILGYLGNIGGWLDCDVGCTGWRDLAKVREFLANPDVDEIMLGSNAYTVIVHKDTTTISYDYEYCNPEMVPCTLPTEMLCEILEIWIQAEKEHREKTKKTEE